MQILIVNYSRTGNTRFVTQKITQELKADKIEIEKKQIGAKKFKILLNKLFKKSG